MRQVLILTVAAGALQVEVRKGRQPVWRGSVECDGPDDLVTAVAQLASAGAPLSGKPGVRVEFLPPLVQLRTLTGLPPVRERALGDLVSVQRGRYFRQRGKPLVTAARWVSAGKGEPPAARAAAIEEHWPEGVLAACRAAGLEVETIRPAGEGHENLDLMPTAERLARRGRFRVVLRRWSLAAASGWILVASVALVRFGQEERRVSSRLDALKHAASALTGAKVALRAGSETLAAVAAAEHERAVVLQALATVVEAMPDSSHLTALELNLARTGSMSGFARRTADVLEHLDNRNAVVAPRLVGAPATAVSASGEWQPFTLEFGGRPR